MNITDRIADLSTLWKQASITFPYFDQKEIDWDLAYREYLEKVINAKTDREFHLLLAEFMNLLGDGHTEYMLPRSLHDETGYLPFTLRYIQNEYCIDATTSSCQAFTGAKILSINGVPFLDLIQEAKRYCYHIGNYVSRYRIHQILPFLLKMTGNLAETSNGAFTFDLLATRPNDLTPKTLHLPAEYQQIKTGKLDIRRYNNILYIKLDDFMYGKAAEEVHEAITGYPEIAGILFDLRENVGGMTLNGAKIAELIIPGEFHGCKKRTRSMTGVGLASASQIIQWSKEEIENHIAAGLSTREEIDESKSFITNTHYDKYIDTYGSEDKLPIFTGLSVILTSRHTVSAAEDFIAMFRTNQRATIIGTPTCGTSGTPLMQNLSCGGWMRICSVGYQLMDGTEFIGCGIEPDIPCEISAEDFAVGFDYVLKEGIEFLQKQI